MEKCSISAECNLVSLNMSCSPIFGKFDHDLWSILKKLKIFISDIIFMIMFVVNFMCVSMKRTYSAQNSLLRQNLRCIKNVRIFT